MFLLRTYLLLLTVVVILTVLLSMDTLHKSIKVVQNEQQGYMFSDADCSEGTNETEANYLREQLSERCILKRTENCDIYFNIFRVSANDAKSTRERQHPKIAFSHQVHREIGIFELFLSIIYRPHNHHCIHVDQKASSEIVSAVKSLAKCYNAHFGTNNIFLVPRPISVIWGHVSVLEADLLCLRELALKNRSWNYYINTAGTESPLVTYSQLEAKMLLAPVGMSFMDAAPVPEIYRHRLTNYWHLQRTGSNLHDVNYTRSSIKQPAPPYNLKVYKGIKFVVLTRDMAEFALYNNVAIDYYNWLKSTLIPDESFFGTLATINRTRLRLTGHVVQELDPNTTDIINPRWVNWASHNPETCHGRWIREVCNFAMADLPQLWKKNALLTNKFNLEVDPKAPICHWKHLMAEKADKRGLE